MLFDIAERAKQVNVPIYSLDPGTMWAPTSGQRNLTWLSEMTGGVASVNSNSHARAVAQILAESGTYYALAYYSSAPPDGRFHPIEVNVRRSGVTVRARQGFVAMQDQPQSARAALDSALTAGLPVQGLPVRVAGVPVPVPGRPGAAIAVAMEIGTATLPAGSSLDVAIVVIDTQGKVLAEDRVTVPIRQAGTSAYEWARIASRLELRPGRYVLRAAAHHPGSGASGSAFANIDVPRFDTGLVLGGLTLATTDVRGVERAPVLLDLLSSMPVTGESVGADEDVLAVLRIRTRRSRARERLTLRTLLAVGQEPAREIERIDVEAARYAADGGAAYHVDLKGRLPRGETCTLTIEAHLTSGAQATREITFSVRK